jgi:L-aspartate-alpha-decarboxylase
MTQPEFCPICQNHLVKKMRNEGVRLICEQCGWVYYMNPLPSVAVVVHYDRGNKILLVKRGEAPKKGAWALPTGFVEQHETCEQAAVRELYEETGLHGSVKRLINVHCEKTKKYGSIILIGFEMTMISGRLRPGSDSRAVRFFPLSKLPAIPFSSHRRMITDALKWHSQRFIEVLKSKITKAHITGTQLHYKGSMGIDRTIMEAVGIVAGEKVHVLNYDNGERLETYTIPEKPGSGKFILYGPASKKGKIGDRLCILSYQLVDYDHAELMKPKIAVLDERNKLKRKRT